MQRLATSHQLVTINPHCLSVLPTRQAEQFGSWTDGIDLKIPVDAAPSSPKSWTRWNGCWERGRTPFEGPAEAPPASHGKAENKISITRIKRSFHRSEERGETEKRSLSGSPCQASQRRETPWGPASRKDPPGGTGSLCAPGSQSPAKPRV